MIKDFLNPEGHQNPINGSKVTAILLKRWIWPIGGVASGRICACSLHTSLVSTGCSKITVQNRNFWRSKIMVPNHNFGWSKNMVPNIYFKRSKITVHDRNCGPSSIWTVKFRKFGRSKLSHLDWGTFLNLYLVVGCPSPYLTGPV